MAIFADYTFGLTESYAPASIDNLHEYSSENADYRAFKESYKDMVSIIESIVEYDLQSLALVKEAQDSGRDLDELYMVHENAFTQKVKEIFGKIKEHLEKLWAKIKQVVKTIVAKISSIFMSGKKFVAKYSAELNKVKSKKVKIKGYIFQNTAQNKLEDGKAYTGKFDPYLTKIRSAVDRMNRDVINVGGSYYDDGASTSWHNDQKDLEDKKDDLLDEIRGQYVNKKSVSSDDFAEELFGYYRGSNGYVEEQEIKVSEAMEFLKKDYTAIAKKNESIIEKAFKEAIKEVDNAAKQAEKLEYGEGREIAKALRDGYVAYAREVSSTMSACTSIRQQAFKAWVLAINQQENMCKSVCVKAIGGKVEE